MANTWNFTELSSLTCADPICSPLGNSWRRGGEDKREERDRERPKDRDERDAEEEKGWRVDKENPRRIKNETDDDGWTTVRRWATPILLSLLYWFGKWQNIAYIFSTIFQLATASLRPIWSSFELYVLMLIYSGNSPYLSIFISLEPEPHHRHQPVFTLPGLPSAAHVLSGVPPFAINKIKLTNLLRSHQLPVWMHKPFTLLVMESMTNSAVSAFQLTFLYSRMSRSLDLCACLKLPLPLSLCGFIWLHLISYQVANVEVRPLTIKMFAHHVFEFCPPLLPFNGSWGEWHFN